MAVYLSNNELPSTGSSTLDYAQVKSTYRRQALSHFLKCSNALTGKGNTSTTNAIESPTKDFSNAIQSSAYSELELWLSRERILKQLHNFNLHRAEDYVSGMKDVISASVITTQ